MSSPIPDSEYLRTFVVIKFVLVQRGASTCNTNNNMQQSDNDMQQSENDMQQSDNDLQQFDNDMQQSDSNCFS